MRTRNSPAAVSIIMQQLVVWRLAEEAADSSQCSSACCNTRSHEIQSHVTGLRMLTSLASANHVQVGDSRLQVPLYVADDCVLADDIFGRLTINVPLFQELDLCARHTSQLCGRSCCYLKQWAVSFPCNCVRLICRLIYAGR